MPGTPLKRCRRVIDGIRTGALQPSAIKTVARLLPLVKDRLKRELSQITPRALAINARARSRTSPSERLERALTAAARQESQRQGRHITTPQLRAMIVRAWLEAHPEYSKLL